MFNYREATLDETVEKVLKSTRAAVHAAKRYYEQRQEQDVVDKIIKARKLASIEKIKLKLEEKKE
jgi:hypothetical protein